MCPGDVIWRPVAETTVPAMAKLKREGRPQNWDDSDFDESDDTEERIGRWYALGVFGLLLSGIAGLIWETPVGAGLSLNDEGLSLLAFGGLLVMADVLLRMAIGRQFSAALWGAAALAFVIGGVLCVQPAQAAYALSLAWSGGVPAALGWTVLAVGVVGVLLGIVGLRRGLTLSSSAAQA